MYLMLVSVLLLGFVSTSFSSVVVPSHQHLQGCIVNSLTTLWMNVAFISIDAQHAVKEHTSKQLTTAWPYLCVTHTFSGICHQGISTLTVLSNARPTVAAEKKYFRLQLTSDNAANCCKVCSDEAGVSSCYGCQSVQVISILCNAVNRATASLPACYVSIHNYSFSWQIGCRRTRTETPSVHVNGCRLVIWVVAMILSLFRSHDNTNSYSRQKHMRH